MLKFNVRNKFVLKYKVLVLIAIFVLILLIIYYTIDRKELSSSELLFKGMFNKLQQTIYPIKKGYNKKNIDVCEVENKTLKDEVDELKKLLQLKNTYSQYDSVNATVLYRNVGLWYETLTIDKGSSDGIKNDMLVMGNGGIIGKTINITKYSCDVKLLTSSDELSKITVGITYGEKTVYGFLAGYDYKTDEIIINNVIEDITMKDNMIVVTSGLTTSYPGGILIGNVTKVEKDKYGLSMVVRAKSSASFRSIRYVSVFKRKIE